MATVAITLVEKMDYFKLYFEEIYRNKKVKIAYNLNLQQKIRHLFFIINLKN